MKCLIIAAGKGSRLRLRGASKPLIPILGVPLIERVIRSAQESGADDFYVVTGYEGEQVRGFLKGLAGHLNGICITTMVSEQWGKDNGLSVLQARQHLREPFLLLMGDHLFDPSIVHDLKELPLADGEIVLGVDGNTSNYLIDMEDVTRVKTEGGSILNIGKNLTDFNGFDTGIFMCTTAIFDALECCMEEHGDTTLSGAVQILAAKGQAKAVDVNGHLWIDVDDPAALKRAEKMLVCSLRDKPNDGPVSRYLNRPVSVTISRRLAKYRISPNQISLFSFLGSMLAAVLFTLGGYFTLLLGGLLAQFSSIIDGCDGEVARLKFQSSPYGGWFDSVLDRYADAFLIFGLMWHLYLQKTDILVLVLGFLAILGSFMLSYTADKYDSLMRDQISHHQVFRIGRDLRIFLIFLGAVSNQILLTLIVIAIIGNVETIRRIIRCRNYEKCRIS